MKMVLKSQIKGWSSLSMNEKKSIKDAVINEMTNPLMLISIITFSAILAMILGLVERGLRQIGVKGAEWFWLMFFSTILITACASFLYATMIVNPRILREMEKNEKVRPVRCKENKSEDAVYGNKSEDQINTEDNQ